MKEEISRTGGEAKQRNRLGVLYAQFGLYDEAVEQFAAILDREEYVPALTNMGNIHFLNDEMDQALKYFERADAKDPADPRILLAMARAHHELEDYGSGRKLYVRAKEMDSQLAAKFDYLGLAGEEASRATSAQEAKGAVLWEEE